MAKNVARKQQKQPSYVQAMQALLLRVLQERRSSCGQPQAA